MGCPSCSVSGLVREREAAEDQEMGLEVIVLIRKATAHKVAFMSQT